MSYRPDRNRLSNATKLNWLLDSMVFLGALLAILSGVYFLFIPSGGYQGGQNPIYGVMIWFARSTWSDIHLWGGVLMIAAVLFHLLIHVQWIGMMARKLTSQWQGTGGRISRGAKVNILVDVVIAISFLIAALSGIYFLFMTTRGYQGGRNPDWDPNFIFSRTTWDLIHTWSGVTLTAAALLHIYIHWGWVTKVTTKLFRSLLPSSRRKYTTQSAGI